MPVRDTIVVGASAGGVEALREMLSGLDRDLAAAVLVVLHTPASTVNTLASILSRATELSVSVALDGVALRPGTVVVARPGQRLRELDGEVFVVGGALEGGHRHAVDLMFRSAARALGARTIGVVLSGSLDDGASGLLDVHARGGVTVVQDPADALHSGMPDSAIAVARPDHVLPAAKIPALLARLIQERVEDDPEVREPDTREPMGGEALAISGHDDELALREAFWTALNCLEDRVQLSLRMARRAAENGHALSSTRFEEQAGEASRAADQLRRMLDGPGATARLIAKDLRGA